MSYLSSNQLKQYDNEGFVSPINIFSKDKAKEIRNEIELIENEMPEELKNSGRYNAHLISPLLDEVTHNPKILDAVQSLIGKNILVCGTTLFIKNPNEKGFVSYHQDAKYIGLEPHNWVTAWVAITNSNENNGCMRMWSGSHKDNLKDHDQKFNEGNLLTRGQTIKNVPKKETTPLVLEAGQMSLHHGLMIHGSGPNSSDDRRIGVAIRYINPDVVQQTTGKSYAMPVRGVDKKGNFIHYPAPVKIFSKESLRIHKQICESQHRVLMATAKKEGKVWSKPVS